VVDGIECSVVIDAAGKTSRFTPRRTADEFGIQYTQAESGPSGVLNFWFFADGYGGSVSIEGGRSNFCFLIKKGALPRYVGIEDRLVTGPLAYDKLPGDLITAGDAAGMIDPFCGDGMHHALDTGMLAARVVAAGIRRHAAYEQIKREYDAERARRWSTRRMAGAAIRRFLRHRQLFGKALDVVPSALLNRIVNDLVGAHRDSSRDRHAA
jgi:hypothetical protein